MDRSVITLENISKKYRLQRGRSVLGLEVIRFFLSLKGPKRDLWGLRDINLEVPENTTLGVIGHNGAGKSTLLRILAGVTRPTSGRVTVNGRLGLLLNLGAGFHPLLTGRENIFLKGALHGFKTWEIKKLFDRIVAFSELEDFIDMSLREYSSGMRLRLGFAIACHLDPDILLVDEVLAVGDPRFQRKCIERFYEFKKNGKTTVVVSHDLGLITGICDRGLLLKKGRIAMFGSVPRVVNTFLEDDKTSHGAAIIESGRVGLSFDNGKGIIFVDGQEVTTGLGMYTSMKIQPTDGDADSAVFYTSEQAVWEIIDRTETSFCARGAFISVPVVQTWRVSLSPTGQINWQVEMELKEDITFQERQSNIMIKSDYIRWGFNDRDQSRFPEIFWQNYDWQMLQAEPAQVITVVPDGLTPRPLPQVIFNSMMNGSEACVTNTNLFFKGRLLVHRERQNRLFSPGTYPYFQGTIELQI
ncbi:MAG: ABC transporter ATP-binding protein [Deltaproteobacteria bacterium]|nr:ABC transporter ATP-binding protein [Deltaproteobacteria bacterium]